ncbi:MAG TPA: N(G),N(G)-dimethylarginine dimethylaminohydrolase [Fimbriiglobus sp.]
MELVAVTHLPSPELVRCQLVHLQRVPIDFSLAVRQHAAYRAALAACGATVVALETNLQYPDCCFVEDTAVVLDEVAVRTPMGTPARAAEPAGIEPELRKYRNVVRIAPPASLEGGDVLRIGKTLFVGSSGRTNRAGIVALQDAVERYGYRVVPVTVTGCLHLKTAATALPDDSVLVNPAWIPDDAFPGIERVSVHPGEPWGANVVRIGNHLIASSAFPRTIDLLRARGFTVHSVDLSEFAKAEGGVTCLSLLIASS